MSTFIALLRQHHQALNTQYSSQLSPDMRQAMFAMLSYKTTQHGQSLWTCSSCEHHDSQALSCGHRHCPQCQQSTTSMWLRYLFLFVIQHFINTANSLLNKHLAQVFHRNTWLL